MAHDVFISYSQSDKEAADAICHYLERSGIRCWIAPRDVHAGSDWADSISQAIRSAAAVVVVFSENTAESRHVKSEVRAAFDNQQPIIPIRMIPIKPSAGYDYLLGGTHWIDAFPAPLSQHLENIAAKLNGLLGRGGGGHVAQAAPQPSPPPLPPSSPTEASRPRRRLAAFPPWLRYGLPATMLLLLAILVLSSGSLWRGLQSGGPPPKEFLVGTWQCHQMEHGHETLIYWTINADGTTSYEASVDGKPASMGPSTWTYANGLFYEEYQGTNRTGRALIKAMGPDTFELTIVDNDAAEYRGLKRLYHRVRK